MLVLIAVIQYKFSLWLYDAGRSLCLDLRLTWYENRRPIFANAFSNLWTIPHFLHKEVRQQRLPNPQHHMELVDHNIGDWNSNQWQVLVPK